MVEEGATVLAASQRLSRVLTGSFAAQQRSQGRSVWKTPDILPWGGFLNRLWREWLLSGSAVGPLLLNPTQELVLWENVIRESPDGRNLLQVPETAQKAMEAWQLANGYRLPLLSGHFQASEDCAVFATWAKEFEHRLRKNNWLEPARLPDALTRLLREGKIHISQRIYLAGFDEYTPQQKSLLEALGDTCELPLASGQEATEATSSSFALLDSTDELRAAAAWARTRLESNSEVQIAVVVPNLASLRSKVERIFTSVFHPGLTPGPENKGAERAFHISLGVPLETVPLVRAAFQILELGVRQSISAGMGMLLRSPFLAGAERERSKRALLDAKLRRRGFFRLKIKTVRGEADGCPQLDATFRKIEQQLEQLPAEQSPSGWSRSFTQVLKAAGWPGDRTLSSGEFQANRAWNDALSRFATLDLTIERMTLDQALEQLRQNARESVFQPEDEGARVQVMGLFESSGLRFDHLWVMGLHDEALPSPARPNPFLPLALQRAHGLPHSSAARELEVATLVMRRLVASAPEVVLSYPKQDGDLQHGPSPFLDEIGKGTPAAHFPIWTDSMKASVSIEAITDDTAPPVPADKLHLGGTSLLRDMAACYFRAWAVHRAGARALEDPEAGINSRESGTAVHKALQQIWEAVRTHTALCSLTPSELEEIVARSVRAGVSTTKGLGRALEQIRLQRLLAKWLEIEKARQPFTVIESEAEQVIPLAGLQIKARFDRVDQLKDGRQVVLDYKTGVLKPSGWTGDRPDEPQVPLYCVSRNHEIAAAAFAQIRCDALGFKGLEQEPGILPKLGKMDKGPALNQQMAEWRQVLERLSAEFCAGKAQVNPKKNSCDFCALTALCRVKDLCD